MSSEPPQPVSPFANLTLLSADGNDAATIYTSRKNDLESKLRSQERSTIVAIANRASAPLVLVAKDSKVHSGKWVEKPPARINPGQTAMMAMQPELLELSGLGATIKYALVPSSKPAEGTLPATAILHFVNPRGSGAQRVLLNTISAGSELLVRCSPCWSYPWD